MKRIFVIRIVAMVLSCTLLVMTPLATELGAATPQLAYLAGTYADGASE